MGETPKTAPVVAHGGNPQDRATSLHRCANGQWQLVYKILAFKRQDLGCPFGF
ncbi:hypothetical protein [Moorena producens]|uniref:hypothetical protein n=1 Tax=Moorena producens TaxID=1155739 RepID=UPI003C77A31E